MFNKIVTEIKYSPALAGELSAFIRHLRLERNMRQVGLIFIAIALIVQLYATLYPPESANARRTQAFIDGGIQSKDDYLRLYDGNTHNIKDLFNSLGVSRTDIQRAIPGTLKPSSSLYIWTHTGSAEANSQPYVFYDEGGELQLVSFRPLNSVGASSSGASSNDSLSAYIGSTPSLKWFAILKENGNLVTENRLATGCTPEAGNSGSNLTFGVDCEAIKYSLTAKNLTKQKPADSVLADAEDRILYTLSIKNTGDAQVVTPMSVWVGDILDYARLLDKGGGIFSETGNSLAWPETNLAPNESQSRSFIVKLHPVVPSTARGKFDTLSFDCTMSTMHGNSNSVNVACPFTKTVERTTNDLPDTPAKIGILFTASVACFAIFYYARSRQLLAELHSIQHNHSGSI